MRREVHGEDVVLAETVGVVLDELFEHLEENLQFLFALLIVLEGVVHLGQVEKQQGEGSAELYVGEVGEVA